MYHLVDLIEYSSKVFLFFNTNDYKPSKKLVKVRLICTYDVVYTLHLDHVTLGERDVQFAHVTLPRGSAKGSILNQLS